MNYPVVIAPELSQTRDWKQFFSGHLVKDRPCDGHFLYVSGDLFVDYRWELLLQAKQEAHLVVYGDGRGRLSLSDDFSIREVSPAEYVDGPYFGGLSLLTHPSQLPLVLSGKRAVVAEKKWTVAQTAIFLDRDGIIIEDNHYAVDYRQVSLRRDLLDALGQVVGKQTLLFVISNQSGVGRGYFSSEQVCTLHEKLDHDLKAIGLSIAEWVFCPYHKTYGRGNFRKDSFSRKPYPGMVLDICQRYPVDLSSSWMIGDQVTDCLLLPQLKTLHLQGKKDLSMARSPVFSRVADLVQYMKSTQS